MEGFPQEDLLPLDIVHKIMALQAEGTEVYHHRLREILSSKAAAIPLRLQTQPTTIAHASRELPATSGTSSSHNTGLRPTSTSGSTSVTPPPIPPRRHSVAPSSHSLPVVTYSNLQASITIPVSEALGQASSQVVQEPLYSTPVQRTALSPHTAHDSSLHPDTSINPFLSPYHQQQPQYHSPHAQGPLPTFFGCGDPKSAEEFLLDMEQYARGQGVPLSYIVSHVLPAALVGDAFRWWTFVGGYFSWEDFKVALHNEYDRPDYLARLKAELEMRTQHPDEPLSAYVRTISSYYDRIGSTVSDAEKVARVMRQMHPQYYPFLQGRSFANLRDLAVVAPTIQAILWRHNNYRPPPPPTNAVAADLAFSSPTSSGQQSSSSSRGSTDRNACWVCGSFDHFKRNCPRRQGNGKL